MEGETEERKGWWIKRWEKHGGGEQRADAVLFRSVPFRSVPFRSVLLLPTLFCRYSSVDILKSKGRNKEAEETRVRGR